MYCVHRRLGDAEHQQQPEAPWATPWHNPQQAYPGPEPAPSHFPSAATWEIPAPFDENTTCNKAKLPQPTWRRLGQLPAVSKACLLSAQPDNGAQCRLVLCAGPGHSRGELRRVRAWTWTGKLSPWSNPRLPPLTENHFQEKSLKEITSLCYTTRSDKRPTRDSVVQKQ